MFCSLCRLSLCVPPGAEPAFRALETSDCGVLRLLLPWAPDFSGERRGHRRADLFSTSPSPLCLSLGEPEMDTKRSVVWVTGNSTKFSKTVAGGGPTCSEPNPAPSG